MILFQPNHFYHFSVYLNGIQHLSEKKISKTSSVISGPFSTLKIAKKCQKSPSWLAMELDQSKQVKYIVFQPFLMILTIVASCQSILNDNRAKKLCIGAKILKKCQNLTIILAFFWYFFHIWTRCSVSNVSIWLSVTT